MNMSGCQQPIKFIYFYSSKKKKKKETRIKIRNKITPSSWTLIINMIEIWSYTAFRLYRDSISFFHGRVIRCFPIGSVPVVRPNHSGMNGWRIAANFAPLSTDCLLVLSGKLSAYVNCQPAKQMPLWCTKEVNIATISEVPACRVFWGRRIKDDVQLANFQQSMNDFYVTKRFSISKLTLCYYECHGLAFN